MAWESSQALQAQSHGQDPGALFEPQDKTPMMGDKKEAFKLFVAYVVNQIEQRLKKYPQEANEVIREVENPPDERPECQTTLNSLLGYLQAMLNDPVLPWFEADGHAIYSVAIDRTDFDVAGFSVGPEAVSMYFGGPVLGQSILIHEARHLLDAQCGTEGSEQRIKSLLTLEANAFAAELSYQRLFQQELFAEPMLPKMRESLQKEIEKLEEIRGASDAEWTSVLEELEMLRHPQVNYRLMRQIEAIVEQRTAVHPYTYAHFFETIEELQPFFPNLALARVNVADWQSYPFPFPQHQEVLAAITVKDALLRAFWAGLNRIEAPEIDLAGAPRFIVDFMEAGEHLPLKVRIALVGAIHHALMRGPVGSNPLFDFVDKLGEWNHFEHSYFSDAEFNHWLSGYSRRMQSDSFRLLRDQNFGTFVQWLSAHAHAPNVIDYLVNW